MTTSLDYYDPQLTLDLLKALERHALGVEDFQRLHHRGAAANPVEHAIYCRRILGKATKRFDPLRGGNAATARRLKLCLDELEQGAIWTDAVSKALSIQPIGTNTVPTTGGNAGGAVWSLASRFHEVSIFFPLGADRIESGAYETAQRWRGPLDAWVAAQRSGLPLAILFGDASSDSGHVFRWARIVDIQLGDEGTTVKWANVRRISLRASELTKLADGTAIDDAFRRGYALVHTPNCVDLSPESEPSEEAILDAPDDDDLEVQLRRMRLRRHQSIFRENLMNAYAHCCAMTGVAVESVLEAAHLDSHAETGDNTTENGLILRADLHALFDDGLVLIEPETLTIRVARVVTDQLYRDLDGRPLRRPIQGDGPRRSALRARWAKYSHLL